MTEPDTAASGSSDAVAQILARIQDGFGLGTTPLEVHNALALYFAKVSELLELLVDAGVHPQSRSKLEIARSVVTLIARETALHRDGIAIETDDLERPAFLLVLCETIVACIAVSVLLKMNLADALNEVGQHVSTDGNHDVDFQSPMRRTVIKIPEGPAILREYTE